MKTHTHIPIRDKDWVKWVQRKRNKKKEWKQFFRYVSVIARLAIQVIQAWQQDRENKQTKRQIKWKCISSNEKRKKKLNDENWLRKAVICMHKKSHIYMKCKRFHLIFLVLFLSLSIASHFVLVLWLYVLWWFHFPQNDRYKQTTKNHSI